MSDRDSTICAFFGSLPGVRVSRKLELEVEPGTLVWNAGISDIALTILPNTYAN